MCGLHQSADCGYNGQDLAVFIKKALGFSGHKIISHEDIELHSTQNNMIIIRVSCLNCYVVL